MSFLNVILVMIFIGCNSVEEYQLFLDSNENDMLLISEYDPKEHPKYVYRVWPEKGSEISLSTYQTDFLYDSTQPSVCAEFDIEAIIENGDFLTPEEVKSRFSLRLDEEKLFEEPDYIFLRDTGV